MKNKLLFSFVKFFYNYFITILYNQLFTVKINITK